MKANHVTVTYTHAAPFIREALVMACRQAADASTLRDRRYYMGQAYAFGRALEIMSDSGDQTPIEGIHEPGGFQDARGYGYVRRFLGGSGDDFEQLMGIPAVEPLPWPWEEGTK